MPHPKLPLNTNDGNNTHIFALEVKTDNATSKFNNIGNWKKKKRNRIEEIFLVATFSFIHSLHFNRINFRLRCIHQPHKTTSSTFNWIDFLILVVFSFQKRYLFIFTFCFSRSFFVAAVSIVIFFPYSFSLVCTSCRWEIRAGNKRFVMHKSLSFAKIKYQHANFH